MAVPPSLCHLARGLNMRLKDIRTNANRTKQSSHQSLRVAFNLINTRRPTSTVEMVSSTQTMQSTCFPFPEISSMGADMFEALPLETPKWQNETPEEGRNDTCKRNKRNPGVPLNGTYHSRCVYVRHQGASLQRTMGVNLQSTPLSRPCASGPSCSAAKAQNVRRGHVIRRIKCIEDKGCEQGVATKWGRGRRRGVRQRRERGLWPGY